MALLLLALTAAKPKPPAYGIDVSHHNGTINWKKVPRSTQFVYIKATEGKGWVDSQYATNIKKAREQGLKVGSYHFFRMTSSATAQFNNFHRTVKKSQQDLLPMVDVETLDGKSPKALRDSLAVFCRLVEKHYGKKPMIYTAVSHYNDWLAPTYNHYHLYLANYSGSVPAIHGKGTYTIWQYTERGTVAGIPNKVDLARFNPKHGVWSIAL